MTPAGVLGRFAAPFPEAGALDDLVTRALEEDAAFDDRSTTPLENGRRRVRARIVAREAGVLAGVRVARRAFERLAPEERFAFEGAGDGARFAAGDAVLTLEGPGGAILSGERVALNFLQRLSGIATTTRALVDAAAGRIAVTDTRKTTPGLRALEKWAVVVGGGVPHRPDLRAMVMLKENHLVLGGGIARSVAAVRASALSRDLPLTIEVRTFGEALEAARLAPDRILLDNMSPAELRRVAEALGPRGERPELEASGGVRLETIDAIAASGVDVASVGALTHSVRAVDFSLLFEGTEGPA